MAEDINWIAERGNRRAGRKIGTNRASNRRGSLPMYCPIPCKEQQTPHQTDNVEKIARTSQEITKLFGNGLFGQAESLLLSLLDDAECSAKGPKDQKKWNEAGHIYSRVWYTFYRIPGAEDYVSMAKEAIAGFCKRMKEDDPST